MVHAPPEPTAAMSVSGYSAAGQWFVDADNPVVYLRHSGISFMTPRLLARICDGRSVPGTTINTVLLPN